MAANVLTGKRALIGVDIQGDFCEGGRLPVTGGNKVAADAGLFLQDFAMQYDTTVFSQDWHIEPGDHWSDMPDNQTSFVRHCPAGDPGADIHPMIDQSYIAHFVKKGHMSAAFSAFEGVDEDGNTLDQILKAEGIDDIDVIGLAADFCIKATCLGGVQRGYKVRLLLPMTAAVFGPQALQETIAELEQAGVTVVDIGRVLS